jgi:serine/threonine protein kinase
MGEVYKARDTRLERTVAIKVLPAHVASDADVRQRFEREARAVAALNHPHICTLHDIGNQDGTDFLVMEYLEGETLQDRLAKGALPLDQALRYGIEIADALDKAHRARIVHRDLKPGNIMLTQSGTKLLDFGLAKRGAGVVAGTGLSMLPTTPPNLTAQGTILGTLQYMAPEQLEGQEADARTDIFAFGAVLYEMLTGKKTFAGQSQASLIGAILKDDPPAISVGQPLAPSSLDHVVKRCLAKEPDARWQAASDVMRELQWVQKDPAQLVAPVPDGRVAVRERLLWSAAVALAVVAGTGGPRLLSPRSAAPEVRLQVVTPDANVGSGFSLSPDGRSLAFVAGPRLWLRRLDSEIAKPLAGTDGASYPFWSPDSQSIGFIAAGKLKRLDVASGSVQTLTDVQASAPPGAATWNADGMILFGGNPGPVERVFAAGGPREPVTRVGPQQVGHRNPQFLPDGQRFLFFSTGTPEVRGVYVGSLDSNDIRRILEADAIAGFLPPDYALFVRQETLYAQRLDLQPVEPWGEPIPVATPIAAFVNQNSSAAAVSSSRTGLLAYRAALTQSRQWAWFDRTGRQLATVGEPDSTVGTGSRLSPDGRFATVSRTVDGNQDIWLLDLARNVFRRFTTDPATDGGSAWSPDGSRIVFDSNRTGHFDLYLKSVVGDAKETLMVDLPNSENRNIEDWSRDGRYVLYSSVNSTTDRDLWIVPVDGDKKPVAVAHTDFTENAGRISPDSKWMAYTSNESGRNEIYVQRFPQADGKWQISTDGGGTVRWRGDGREIFYTAPDNRLMAVSVTLPEEGANVEVGVPVSLFTMPAGAQYTVTPDGQRFLGSVPTEEARVPPITIILNWRPAGRSR